MLQLNIYIFNDIDENLSEDETIEHAQHLYDKFINTINLYSKRCPKCHSQGNFEIKGYYTRYVYINYYKFRLRIIRYKCSSCNSTHAIFPLDLISYSIYLSEFLFFFLKNSYKCHQLLPSQKHAIIKRIKLFLSKVKSLSNRIIDEFYALNASRFYPFNLVFGQLRSPPFLET